MGKLYNIVNYCPSLKSIRELEKWLSYENEEKYNIPNIFSFDEMLNWPQPLNIGLINGYIR